MSGINAWRIVAIMADKKPTWNLSVGENPRNPMCSIPLAFKPKTAIAIVVCGLPQPAFIRAFYVDLGPEPGELRQENRLLVSL